MAETDSKYKDSFISQDELDRLLKGADALGPEAFAGSESEDETGLRSTTEASAADDDIINQDDIDALLSLADKDPNAADADNDLISQEDIDALLAGNRAMKASQDEAEDNDDDAADLDLVSPEDIEKLMRSDSFETDISVASDLGPKSENLDTITQDDLQALTQSTEIKAEAGGLDSGDDDALISQDDINAILAGARQEEEPEPEMQQAPPAPVEPIAAAAPSAPAVDEVSEDEEDSLISQDDIDSLLAGAGISTTKEDQAEKEEETNLISQEDIDKLLLGKGQEAEPEETLIDQDDIDRLLNSARPFDEASLRSSGDQEKIISQEDIDQLLNEDFTDSKKDAERILDQVILEKSPDSEISHTEKAPSTWYRSKLFVSMAAVGLVLVVSLISVMLFSGKPDTPPVQTDIATAPEPEAIQDTEVPREIETQMPQTMDIITVSMNGFVVPAPANIKGLSYIALNLTLEISDSPTNPIKDYEPFFRNIVYEVINKAFVLQSEAKIVEADLKKMIRDALNDALSEGSVSRIDFSDFKVG